MTKKNACGSKMPPPPPPHHNFSNGPSLSHAKEQAPDTLCAYDRCWVVSIWSLRSLNIFFVRRSKWSYGIGVWPAQCKFAQQRPTWRNSMQHVTVCYPTMLYPLTLRQREKSNGSTLSFLMATLAEENFWTLKVHLVVTLLKIRLEL